MINLINARIEKLNNLISKYKNELNSSSISKERHGQVKAYVHCFRDELDFLTTLNDDDEVDSQNAEFDFDDEQF